MENSGLEDESRSPDRVSDAGICLISQDDNAPPVSPSASSTKYLVIDFSENLAATATLDLDFRLTAHRSNLLRLLCLDPKLD